MSENNRFTFVVSDESLNKYGSRVMTSGIDIEEFKANPVMFWNHKRDEDTMFGSSPRDRMPIGRWENIRKDGGKLIADAVLDLNDNTGKKVAQKLRDGFLNASSIGIGVIELSEEPIEMLRGQTRPTITKSKLLEVSIVDVPANGNALKLSFPLDYSTLTLDASATADQLNELLPIVKHGASLSSALNDAIDNMVTDDTTRGDIIEDMGRAAGISANTVSNILSENIDCPPLARLEGFASALTGVSVNDLRNAAERDGCEYGEENNFNNMTIQEQINNSLNGFFDKLKESFNFSPKEGSEAKPESVMSDLFVGLNASIQAIEIPAATDHSEQIEKLNASMEKLNADNAKQSEQIESMKGEIIEFRGKKGGEVSTNDMAPISDKANKDEPIDKEAAKLQAAGEYFKNKFKNH